MADRIKGITVQIGGDTTGLSKALEGVNRSIGATQSQLRDVNRLLKLDPKNVVLLEQKQRLLADATSATQKKLEQLEIANQQVAENTKNYDAWKAAYTPIQDEIVSTRDRLKELKKQQQDMLDAGEADTSAYAEITDAVQNTAKELRNLEKQAKEVSNEFGNPVSPKQYDALQREIEDTRIKLQNLQSAADATDAALWDIEAKPLENIKDTVEDVGEALEDTEAATISYGDVIKAHLLSDAIMRGLEKLIGLVKNFASGMIDSAATVQAENAQFAQTFGELETSARTSLQAVAAEAGITATRMQGSYTMIYAFAKTAGADTAQAMDIASRSMRAASDSAAYYDRSIENATETLQSFLKGNYANDAALGIAATETTRNTAANKKYAKSFQELSEAQKVDVLLSMVEAGNKASGALGQAAREAGSWENVTGELNEAYRQLQATIGAPVLEQVIPVIQTITQKLSDASQRGKFDQLAQGIGNTFGWLIEHGDTVISTVAGITAAFVAMKAVQKAEEIVTLASGLIHMGQAATAAGTAVAASSAAISASPWGLAATAISLVVGAVTALVTSSKQSEEETSELQQSVDQLAISFDDANQRMQATKSEVDGAAYAAKSYTQRLRELEASGLNTAAAHKEYALTVEALNELIPELNLSVNAQTGLIDQNIDALERDIDAWKRNATAKALQERFTAQLEAQGRAQADVITAQAKRNQLERDGITLEDRYVKALEEKAAAQSRMAQAEQALSDASGASLDVQEALRQERARLTAEYDLAEQNATDLSFALQANIKEQEKLTEEINEAQGIVDSYEQELLDAEAAMKNYTEQTEDGIDATGDMSPVVQKLQDRLDALKDAYTEARDSARDSLDTQIGLFDELSIECELSVQDMIRSLQSQQVAMDNYAENLRTAARWGIDDGLLKSLSDGSVESMQYLQAIVDGGEGAIDDLNAAFAKSEQAKEELSDELAAAATGAREQYDEMKSDAQEAGLNIVDGLVTGVTNNSDKFYRIMANMAGTGAARFREYYSIYSPSRLMADYGKYIDLGLAQGVEAHSNKFALAMEKLSSLGDASFAPLSSHAVYNSVESTQNTQSVSLGGLSVYVNAGQINDPDQLADLLADRIQEKVASRSLLHV